MSVCCLLSGKRNDDLLLLADTECLEQVKNILVVVNDRYLRSAILAFLEKNTTYDVKVSRIPEVIDALYAYPLDIMILDLDYGGLDLLIRIRESTIWADLPILVLLNWDIETETLFKYLEPGDYLRKPFDMRLLDVMVSLCNKQYE